MNSFGVYQGQSKFIVLPDYPSTKKASTRVLYDRLSHKSYHEQYQASLYLSPETEISLTYRLRSWIGSFQFMMPFFIGLVAGKLHDNGYFHHLEITGAILFTVRYAYSFLFDVQ